MDVKPIRVLQCNAMHCNNSQIELTRHFMSNNFSIALISEPYVGSNTTLHAIRGVNIFQFPTNGRVKACILIKESFGVAIGATQYSTSNLAVAKVNLGQRKLFIASTYIEPNDDANGTINAITSFLSDTKGSLQLVGGDFNASHQLWNCEISNERGNTIADMIHANNMAVCNIGNTPTFEAVRHQNHCSSIVDITLASENLIACVDDWTVNLDACSSSDHNAIEFKISMDANPTPTTRTTTYLFNNKTAKWHEFREALRREINASGILELDINSLTEVGVDHAIETLTFSIRNACFQSMKLRGNAKPYNPWWSERLERLKRNVLRYHHKAHDKKSRGVDYTTELVTLCHAKKAYAKMIRKESTKHFREFCQKQGKEDVWSITNRLIKDAPGQRPPSTLRLGNAFTDDGEDTANALLDHFYPNDNIDTHQRHKYLRETAKTTPTTPDEPFFTTDEVLECINSMSPNRAPGVDNLTSDICHAVIEEYPSMMTDLFNRSLELQHFPTPWKTACIKILPKANKDNYSDLASFRPIGLLPVFGKVMEKLFVKRLSYHAQVTEAWSPRQFGFREQTSTTDALITAINAVKESKSLKRQVLGVSLDIKAAFDNAWWPALFNQLRKTNCPKNLFGLIQSYFHARKVELKYGEAHASKEMSRGCIQGSVCGPIFWNLILDELLTTPLPTGCHIQAFADDVLLIVNAENVTNLETTTNDALAIIAEWGRSVKLTFSPNKTQAITFTPNAKNSHIQMDGVDINFESKIKVLGVVIDERLKFSEHVKYAISKATRVFKNLCKFVRPTWGVHSDNVTTIYRQVIEPIITYAAGVWGEAVNFQYIKKILRSFQRSFAIRAIRGFHTVSAVSALALAQFMPLHLKIREIHAIETIKRTGNYHAIPDDNLLERPVKPKEKLHPAERKRLAFDKVNNQEAGQRQIITNKHIYRWQ